jgi:SAM-dependent methyltransferase
VTKPWREEDVVPYNHGNDCVRGAWQRMWSDYRNFDDRLESDLARRIAASSPSTFVELGGGDGPISKLLAPLGIACAVIDRDPVAWDDGFSSAITGDLRALPLRDGSVDAASAINCLYFLADPRDGIREAWRALRSGGLFVAGAPSRYHDIELKDVDPNWGQESPFDAEEAADHVAVVFGSDAIEVEDWHVRDCWLLPTYEAVVDYLVAFNVPEPEDRARRVTPPIGITKKGTTVWAVKP